jgi:16S rRNA processing protein RimM
LRAKPPNDPPALSNPTSAPGPAASPPSLLVVATVRRPHGLSGEVSVQVDTSFPERFQPGGQLLWRRGERERRLRLRGVRPHGDRLLLRFEGVDDPDAARDLSGGELCVPGEEPFPAPEGFYYSHQVEGWRCEDAVGRPLGTVAGLEQTVSGPLLTVLTPSGKSVLVPFVAAIVTRIEDAGHRIVLEPPDGLFEL